MRTSAAARRARDYVADNAPADALPLPLSYAEREARKVGGVSHLMAWYAESLEACHYDFGIHPLFEPYARGVLASPYAPHFITQDAALQQRFPAQQLKGLGPGLHWRPSPARTRRATLWQKKLFLRNPPPPKCQGTYAVVDRRDANVPPWYAPGSNAFLQLDDEFVAHATKLAAYKRLPNGWEVYTPAEETFSCIIGIHKLWAVKSDYGWLIERKEWLGGPEEVLANVLVRFPVLCDTYVTAARLAEAAHKGLPPAYQLVWIPLK